jgi:hypothetical protein
VRERKFKVIFLIGSDEQPESLLELNPEKLRVIEQQPNGLLKYG